MDVDKWTKFLQVGVSLLQVISWPLIVFFLLFSLRKPLKKFIENMSEINLKAGGVEATLKKQIEVAASLGAAEAAASIADEAKNGKKPSSGDSQGIANLVGQIVTPQTSRQLHDAKVLWVDDIPDNNIYQKEALGALGIRFTESRSTDDAVEKLKETSFDAIISDMGRPPDKQAGYTLLDKIKQMNITTPVIIYARGGNRPENRAEARRRGAFASVSSPQMLFETVIDVIKSNHS